MKVLLAVDESPCSRTAEAVLSTFPFSESVDLQIVSVCPAPSLHAIATIPTAIHEIIDECREKADRHLNEAAERCRGWAASVESELLDGHPAKELLVAIDRLKPDLVAVGARRLGTISRVLLGSVSERIAKYAPTSVLVARGHADRTDINNIVIGHDGASLSEAAIDRFASMPLGEARSIHLYSLIEEVHAYGINAAVEAQGIYRREHELAKQRLPEAAARLEHTKAHVETHIKQTDNLGDALVEAAAVHDADLVVVGATGKAAWERFLIGSVSMRVLHHAPCSVWIERPHSK